MIDRRMARCERDMCRRWITITPADAKTCPSCALSGIESRLEIVDMAAHIDELPKAVPETK